MAKDIEVDKYAKVEAALGEPIGCELTEDALKIRRNLLAVSFISIAVVLAGIRVGPSSTILGVTFEGLTEDLIHQGLVGFILYFGIHFIWVALEGLQEWRIRVTGTRLSYVTSGKFASEEGDYPNDPRQSSLYTWWILNSGRIGNVSKIIPELQGLLAACDAQIKGVSVERVDGAYLTRCTSQLNEIKGDIFKLQKAVDGLEKIISSDRIPVSLSRFDKAYGMLLRSQNLRWLVIDVGFPIVSGIYAAILLFASIRL